MKSAIVEEGVKRMVRILGARVAGMFVTILELFPMALCRKPVLAAF